MNVVNPCQNGEFHNPVKEENLWESHWDLQHTVQSVGVLISDHYELNLPPQSGSVNRQNKHNGVSIYKLG